MKKHISLTQYLVEVQRQKGLIPGELRLLLEVVARVFGTAIAPALGSAVTGAMTRSLVGLLRGMCLRLECACAVLAGHLGISGCCHGGET